MSGSVFGSAEFSSPAGNQLGPLVMLVPVAGAVVVGLMARYGSAAIRGHGIPEAMEQVLLNKSRIPARITLLKPISAAIAIGTGGPFGAEGPIIATGGALGSLIGQLLHTTAAERKTLLAAGAAAGMTATFGSPVSAVLLAVELLLFELRPRSLIPVSLAAAAATAVRIAFVGVKPAFAMPNIGQPGEGALAAYVLLGALVGVAAVGVTRIVYAIEDAFEHLPIHWMWWPALGAVAVGVCGYFAPNTLGVGYDNIDRILSGDVAGGAAFLGGLKFVPVDLAGQLRRHAGALFTIGGAFGALLGRRLRALSRTSASIRASRRWWEWRRCSRGLTGIFWLGGLRLRTTRKPMGLLPLLGGCTACSCSPA
jgi:H+/Cl- antiporter ClcA